MSLPDSRPRSARTGWIRNWLVFLLMLVIAANELQRTEAQASAHRERVGQTISLTTIDRKLDWLLLNSPPPPTASRPAPRPAPASARPL